MTTSADAASGKGATDENFPVASHLIAPKHRPAVMAFYDFVRAADDVADNATLPADEKLAILEFPQFITPTIVTRSEAAIKRFHAEHKDLVLKPLDGMGGMGIFRVGADGLNLGSIVETLNRNGTTTVMAQRYLTEITAGDKRILVIDGVPVSHALARIPQGSEIRGNLAVGGKGVAQPLSDRDREIAEALGPTLAARGLLLIGLDVIGDCLTEINVTSPTGFQEITQQAGVDVARLFVDALERRLGAA